LPIDDVKNHKGYLVFHRLLRHFGTVVCNGTLMFFQH
jgi:hypothetical protein